MSEWTIPSLPAEPGWHGGRTHALVWACELGDPAGELVRAARARLGGLLLERYERQPHITVRYAGLLAAPGLAGYDQSALADDLARLRPLVSGPLILLAEGWDSFPMVPYLAVASNWLHAAYAVLPSPFDDGPLPYRPHLTAGQYARRVPMAEARAALSGLAATGRWRISALSLLRYDADDISGPLSLEGRLDLSTGEFAPAADSLLLAASEPAR